MKEDPYVWLETQQTRMTADLIELANQNSGSDNCDGLQRVSDWLEDWMDLAHSTFTRVHLPARRIVCDDGTTLAMETGPVLRWDYLPQCERRVLLMIHYDTVFGAQHAFQSCQRLSSEKLCGPGVADAKGGIIALRNALKALTEIAHCRECGWTVLLNPDEELGSPCSAGLLQELAAGYDFGLLFEPALPNGTLVSQRKGSGNFDIVVRGKSAHAGRHFDQGRNAVTALSQLVTRLDGLNGSRQGLTINVGSLRGGGAVNVVPDLAIARVNVRVPDTESAQWIQRQLQDLVKDIDSQDGFLCQLHGALSSPPKLIDDATRQLMRAVEFSTRVVGGAEVEWMATGGVCDGNKLAAAGLPNIDTLGPIGGEIHSSNEWVNLPSLVQKSKLIVHLLSHFASGEYATLQRQSN